MNRELAIKFEDKKFPFYVRRSFYVHAFLLSLTLVSGKVIIEKRKAIQEKNLELVEASVRVDMVAMPKYTLNELKNVSSGVEDAKKEEAAPQESKTETKVEKEEVKEAAKENPNELALLEESKKKRQDFLSKLKEIGSKKVKANGDQKAEKGLGGEKATALKELVLAGNKVSSGVAITGNGNTAEMTAFQVYVAKLPDRIRPHWRLPTFLMGKKLRCLVLVKLDSSGNLIRAEIYKSSENPEYDQKALEAVRSTSFPTVSNEFKDKLKDDGVLLGFPL